MGLSCHEKHLFLSDFGFLKCLQSISVATWLLWSVGIWTNLDYDGHQMWFYNKCKVDLNISEQETSGKVGLRTSCLVTTVGTIYTKSKCYLSAMWKLKLFGHIQPFCSNIIMNWCTHILTHYILLLPRRKIKSHTHSRQSAALLRPNTDGSCFRCIDNFKKHFKIASNHEYLSSVNVGCLLNNAKDVIAYKLYWVTEHRACPDRDRNIKTHKTRNSFKVRPDRFSRCNFN